MKDTKLMAAARKIAAMFAQGNELRAYLGMAPVKSTILQAGLRLAELGPDHPMLDRRTFELDEAMKFLHMARTMAVRASRGGDKAEWRSSRAYFKAATRIAKDTLRLLESGSDAPVEIPPTVQGTMGDGIETADGIPLVPPILPVVFLSGSDREMGRQYATQVAGLFGAWVLERKAGRRFTRDELEILGRWEEQLAAHCPEIIEFAEGMSEGARGLGVDMDYENALEIWTGVLAPEADYFGAGGLRMRTIPPLACSGVAAWGRATADGRLVTGSAGDFDPTFTAAMAVWPKTGNPYVYTPFGATGDVPALGSVNMFGHPGMNSKGLAYVHHGGTPKMIEPKSAWGYGLRRAPAVMHILRFADDAKGALDMELSFPIGDVGIDSGTVGGFWADDRYGFALESRADPVLVREAGMLGETDFLFSANSALHPEAGNHGWLALERDKWTWKAPYGWSPKQFSFFHKLGLVYWGSARRGAAFFKRLDAEKGRITLETMLECYRRGGTLPEGPWKRAASRYNKTGYWGELSPGNASNGILAFMKPSERLYSACVGPLTRGIAPSSPLFASFNPVRGQANACWDLRLEDSADASAERASKAARDLASMAARALAETAAAGPRKARAEAWAAKASVDLEEGFSRVREALELSGDERLAKTAGAASKFLSSQVRSRQAFAELGVGQTQA